MNFAKRLRFLRAQKGLSQAETARRLNINRITYGQYETGRRHPDYETLQKIADFFNCSLDYLLGREVDEVVDIKEALENKTKKATWGGKELTDEQREKLKKIFAVIRDELLAEGERDEPLGKMEGQEGRDNNIQTAI